MKYLKLLLLLLLLNSCSSFDMILHPNSYKKIEYPKSENKISGNVLIRVDDDDIIKPVVAGERPQLRGVLSNVGERARFKRGEVISLSTNGIDFDKYTLKLISEENSSDIIITVVDKFKDDVKMVSKCQTLTVYDTRELPKMQIENLNGQHQIIVTPVFNNKSECKLLGYQVRYGDQRLSNCRQQAKYVYDTFISCNDYKKAPTRRPKTLEEILFGK